MALLFYEVFSMMVNTFLLALELVLVPLFSLRLRNISLNMGFKYINNVFLRRYIDLKRFMRGPAVPA